MPYWTQGVATFHSPVDEVSINPINDYKLIYEKKEFTIFVDGGVARIFVDRNNAKVFPIDCNFWIDTRLKDILMKAAFSKICLKIGIDVLNGNKISDVIVPSRC